MTLYEVLLFVHVGAAILWVGGAVMHVTLMTLARGARQRSQQISLLEYDDVLGLRFYVPSALVVLAAGIWLVVEGGWDWSNLWIVLGLGIFAFVFIFGSVVFLPQGKKLRAAIDGHGADSAEVGAILDRMYALSWVDVALLAAAVAVMTLKPGL